MTLGPDLGRRPSPLQPWGVLATLGWLVLAFAASAAVAVAFYGAWLGARPRPSTDIHDGVLVAIGALASFPVQVAVLAMAAQLRRWPVASYLALNVPRRGEIVMAALCVVALIVALNAALYLTGRSLVTPFQIETYRTAKDASWLPWLLLAIVIIAPAGEEIAFRGFVFRGLARPGWEIHAIVVIALVWSLMHIQYDWFGMAQIFAIGLVLGWFRWASGSTTLAILMHVLINLESMIETAIQVEYLS